MVIKPDSIAVIGGEPKSYERPRSDGRKKNIVRCPNCLTALWGVRPDGPNVATLYAGTLDDTSSLEPVAHIWTRSRQPWIQIPPNSLNFDRQPTDVLALVEASKSRSPGGSAA
jgi:hypothetical protein